MKTPYHQPEHKLSSFTQKAKKWCKYNYGDVLALTMIVVVIGGVSFGIKKISDHRKQKQEKFKQEIIKEALEQFKQEQQKQNSAVQYQMQNTK